MHPKYWKRPRLMSEFEGESSSGGSMDSLADSFAGYFDDSAPADPVAAPAAETQDDVAARLAAEDAAPAKDDSAEHTDPAADTGAEPDKFTVKVDGKDVVLTADELAEHVKSGMRQQDYTRKTTEAAEVRKTADAEIAQTRAKRDEYGAKLEQFSSQANYEVNALKASLTQDLLQSDPLTYLNTQRIVEARQAELAQAQQELHQINGQRQTEAVEAQRQTLAHQQEQLLAKVPEWKDPAKAKEEVAKIKDYLSSQGYQAGESDFTDHRQVVLARKAMQYDALMARAQTAQATVAKAPVKVARTGTPAPTSTDGRSTAARRFEQTGTRTDAAAYFAEFF